MALRRLDSELVRRKLAKSRAHAQEMIDAGQVKVSGQLLRKSATQVETSAPIVIADKISSDDYVSRGAHKLLGALSALGDRAPTIRGKRCLDAGASTGGFTDVLLRKGASSVLAVDVGYGQLAWQLRSNPKVEVLERTNIRYLEPEQVGQSPSLVVGDLSFISLELVIPALIKVAPNADFLLMVKPQFEVGKGKLGRGGVVWDADLRVQAVEKVAIFSEKCGLNVWAIEPSPLPGPSGNVEYFLAMSTSTTDSPRIDIKQASIDAVERGPHPEKSPKESPHQVGDKEITSSPRNNSRKIPPNDRINMDKGKG